MIWTPELREHNDALQTGDARDLVAARLLKLVLSKDDRVAVDAAKLLIDGQLLAVTTRINLFADVDPDELARIRRDANAYIRKSLGDGGAGSGSDLSPGAGGAPPA